MNVKKGTEFIEFIETESFIILDTVRKASSSPLHFHIIQCFSMCE